MKKFFILLFLALFPTSAFAGALCPYPAFTALKDNGDICAGCSLYTYKAGTSTTKVAWKDSTGSTAHTNPIVMNAYGRPPGDEIWLTGHYKFTLIDTDGEQIWEIDNVRGIGSFDLVSIGDYNNNLHTALADIGATETTLLIDDTITVGTNETVPATCALWFTRNGQFTISAGITVTINGEVNAGLFQIFDISAANATVEIGSVSAVPQVYPQWWGALGNDSSDNAEELQAAISGCPSDGGVVAIVGGGVYQFASDVTMQSNLTIKGDKQTTLKSVSGASLKIGSITRPSSSISYSDISLLDLIVQGSGTNSDPDAVIDIWETRRVRVEGCVLHTTGDLQDTNRNLALRIETCADVSVKNNFIYDVNGTGVLVYGFEGHVQVDGNHIRSCADDCINVQEDSDSGVDDDNTFTIHGNTVELCGLDAGEGLKVSLEDTDRFMGVISDNAIYRPCQEGIIVRWPSGAGNPTVVAESQIVVSGNVIKDAGWSADAGTECTDNGVGVHLLSGIRIVNGHSHVEVVHNSIKNAYGYGIGKTGDANHVGVDYLLIQGNTIEDVIGYGIYTADTQEVIIKDNVVDTVSTGSLDYEAGITASPQANQNTIIDGNLITNMGSLDGLYIRNVTPVNISNNKIDGSDEGVVFDYTSGTPWIEFVNNTVVNATGNGIEFPSTANEDITGGDWKGNHISCAGDQLAGPTDVSDAPDDFGTISGEAVSVYFGTVGLGVSPEQQNLLASTGNGIYLINAYIMLSTTLTADATDWRSFYLYRNGDSGQQIRLKSTISDTITQWVPFEMNNSGGFVSEYCYVAAGDSVTMYVAGNGSGSLPEVDDMVVTVQYITF